MYRYETDIKYSEVAGDCKIRPHQIINYFQDCSVLDSEAIGKGLSYMNEHKRGWLLSSWQVEILSDPVFMQNISVGTWPYNFTSMFGYRNFDICDETGRQMVRANSIWCMVDTETGTPVKLTDEDISGYDFGEPIDMPQVSRKLKFYHEGERPVPFAVRRNDIDSNGHVNNAKYVAFAEEYLPEDFHVKKFKVQYRQAAKYGAHLYPLVTKADDIYAISLCDEAYRPYVSMEFME